MPDSELQQWYVKIAPGMNNKTEDLDLGDKWVQLAQNCRFEDEPRSVTKREPVTYYNNDFTGLVGGIGDGAVTGLYRFYAAGTGYFIMVHDTTCYVGNDALGTWTPIRTGLSGGKRMDFETYQDKAIMSNGFDNIFVFDGDTTNNVTWELGSCKAVLVPAGAITRTGISYKVTFDGDAYISGAVSNEVDASGENIQLSNIPLGPLGTTDRKIYRIDSNVTPNYRLVTTIANNSDTDYLDVTDDISAGAILGAVTNSGLDAIPKGSMIKIHRERLFISGDPSFPNRIYFSNVYRPHYIQVGNLDYLEIAPEDGDEIMGIPIQLSIMMCIKKNTIRRIHITAPTSGADPNTWTADDPQVFTGSPAQWSIQQTPYGIIFLGWDSWYRFDGSKAEKIFDEFDTYKILPSAYLDVVGFYHKGVFLAAYTNISNATQFHDTIMRYNFQRTSLSLDTWTSSTISGANCFASKSGDDETGELYYGDSQLGYVVKAKESELSYQLRTKTEANAGVTGGTDPTANVFIGGTENAPYIEIGATNAADPIPDDLIIFWDSETTTPGTGWTEITANYDDHYMIIDSTAAAYPANKTAATTHDHTVTGTLPSANLTANPTGDQGGGDCNDTNLSHTHSLSLSGSAVSDVQAEPRNIKFRMFKSSSVTTTEFPVGSICMWDQTEIPVGWSNIDNTGASVGYYVKAGTSGLNTPASSAHDHTYSGLSSARANCGEGSGVGDPNGASGLHAHQVDGTTGSESLDSWELAHVNFHFIKKTGESDSWDGTDKFVYVFTDDDTDALANGWALETAYDGLWLKPGGNIVPTTGAAAGGTHSHSNNPTPTVAENNLYFGTTYPRTFGSPPHNHGISGLTVDSVSNGTPATATLRMVKLQLGKMTTFNTATNGLAITNITQASPAVVTTSAAHGFVNDTAVYISDVVGMTEVNGNTYYVKSSPSPTTFELETTAGGPDLDSSAFGVYTSDGKVSAAAGTWTSPAQQINAESLQKIFWNETNTAPSTDDILFYTRTGSSQVNVEAAAWQGPYTDPNGSLITTVAAPTWVQYKVEFTAADTKADNPRIFFTNAYVVKYTYSKGDESAETSVNFHYDIGRRNFDDPMSDKIFKKIQSVHTGTEGSFTVEWITENANNSFIVDLSILPRDWDSFFHDMAMGREIDYKISKNDLFDFSIKELKGIYTTEPTIL